MLVSPRAGSGRGSSCCRLRPSPLSSLTDDGGEGTPGSSAWAAPALQLPPSTQDGDTSAGVRGKSTAELAGPMKEAKGIED